MPPARSSKFTIADQVIDFPNLAGGTAIKHAADRFSTAWDLPVDAAFALATSMVDPARDRQQLDPKDPFAHLQEIQTPDGKLLLAHRTQVWTPRISGDGGNGRSRYDIQTDESGGQRKRPWPIGRHHKPAIIDYRPASLGDMTAAVAFSAEKIHSHDLISQVSQSKRGVWNPPVVVLARAYVAAEDGTADERWFLHAVDGSTRVEACHELTGITAMEPLQYSNAPLEHLRKVHAQFVERFETTPTSNRTLGASRAATMPALIIIDVVDGDSKEKVTSGFPTVINDYVESVHVQPRPFSEVAQANVIGERFILKLQLEQRLTANDAHALLGRDSDIVGRPSVRAAKLVHAVCAQENDKYVRSCVITEPGARLTKTKRAKLVAPLVVRQFPDAAGSAERALMRPFTPDLLIDRPWAVTGMSSDDLRERCIGDFYARRTNSPAIAELIARGGPALAAAGLLLGDQESTVKAKSKLRGTAEKVLDHLSQNLGGLNVLADAIAWADGEQLHRPRIFDVEGHVVRNNSNEECHFTPGWEGGNMRVRALAFNNGEVPDDETIEHGPIDHPENPDESYTKKERRLIELLMNANNVLMDMYQLKDEYGNSIIETRRMQRAAVYKNFPHSLTWLHSRYGADSGPFNEDDLPEAPATSQKDVTSTTEEGESE